MQKQSCVKILKDEKQTWKEKEKKKPQAEWLERLTADAAVATVLGSIPTSSGTVESEGRQMKQC